MLALAPGPLWGAGLPRPHVGGWGGGRLISRAKPLAFSSPRRPRQRRRGRGAAAAAACTQAGRVRIALHKFACFKACALQGGAGSLRRRGPTRRAFARCVRCRRTGFFSGSGARVRGAAWGSAHRRPGGATAPKMATQAAVVARARPAPARCLVLGRCRSPAPYCGSMASSATWSACRAKVPGQDALRTAIQGRVRVFRPRPRAAALRRVRPPRRREGLFVCVR